MDQSIQQLFIALKALVVHEGKILLLQESAVYEEGTNAGKWDVPGGRLQPGEQWSEALLREVREETGLNVTIGAPLGVGEWRPVIKGVPSQIVGVFMLCQANTTEVQLSSDHSASQWFVPEDILQLINITPETQAMIRLCIERQK